MHLAAAFQHLPFCSFKASLEFADSIFILLRNCLGKLVCPVWVSVGRKDGDWLFQRRKGFVTVLKCKVTMAKILGTMCVEMTVLDESIIVFVYVIPYFFLLFLYLSCSVLHLPPLSFCFLIADLYQSVVSPFSGSTYLKHLITLTKSQWSSKEWWW